ncbi:MFS transporter [Andreprevotia chitinilytica]|uniref:MFS transporter n=1 Tax=Andreprevotia chitinilytica TaxID=396808 RepID=UPI00054FE2B0|nr:MFS transporter [Andreprevotia chitinilytica]
MKLRLSARIRHEKKRLLMALLGLITAVEFLENLMFVFAASHIVGGIDAAPREFAQVQAAYAIGSMLMIVKQQWLAKRFGYRRYLSGALALFVVGALASAASHNLIELTGARFMQGVGGGALFTSSRILINVMFPSAERPRALKYFMVMIFGASAVAPALAASLVETHGWEWVFYGAVPPAMLALAGCWFLLPETERDSSPVKYDAWPLMLFAVAIVSLQLMLSQTRYDFFAHSGRLVLLALLGSALLAGFLWQQYRHPDPLLHVRELHSSVYLTGLGLYFLHYFLSNFSSYLFPVYAEQALGMPLVTVGWLNTFAGVIGLGVAYGYVKFGRCFPNKKPLMLVGALAMALTAWLFARMPPDATPAALMPALLTKGFFSVLLVMPVAGLTFRELGDERFAHGYQGKNLMRQIAGSISTAIAAVLMQNRQFAVRQEISARLTPDHLQVASWLDTMQHALAARGFAQEQAHAGALAELARVVERQAQLIACEDLYLFLAAAALVTAMVVGVQRKLL